VDGNDGAAKVVFARKEHALFEHFEAFAVAAEFGLEFAVDRFAFTGEFEQGFDVACETSDLAVLRDGFFEALAILQNLLAAVGLIPEVGRRDFSF
jgi:hypothetical protein